MNQLIKERNRTGYLALCALTILFGIVLVFCGLSITSFNPSFIDTVLSAQQQNTSSPSREAYANLPFAENCRSLQVEAEDGVLLGLFTVGEAASEGRTYVHVPQGKGDRFDGPDQEQKATYCIETPTAGKYILRASVHAQGASNNSLYVRVDDLPSRGFVWNIPSTFGYAEAYVTSLGQTEPVVFDLDSGKHIFEFFLREDDTRLDYLQLEPVIYSASQDKTVSNFPLDIVDSASSIYGFVHTETGDPWLPLMADPQIANITVNVLDAETLGQKFATAAVTDEFGNYQILDMLPGKYLVELSVPYGHRVIGPSMIEINIVVDQPSMASFDLLVLDHDSSFIPELEPDKARVFMPVSVSP